MKFRNLGTADMEKERRNTKQRTVDSIQLTAVAVIISNKLAVRCTLFAVSF